MRLRVAGCALCVFGLTACYQYVPMQTTTAANPRVEVLVTDRGRVELQPQLGQGVLSFEGTLDGRQDSSLVVHVAEVTYLNRQTNRWSGEAVTLSQSAVRDIRIRRLSKRRTFAMVAGSIAAGLVFIVSRSLLGLGSSDSGGGPIPNPQDQ
jgi:hypothetical protein